MRKSNLSRHYSSETVYPNVYLAVRKNRIKIYNSHDVFLNHGDEFELEFDNTSRSTWLAKIKLNGEWVSEAGLVLRPGEHVYLDTPDLDSYSKGKFTFSTYEIESGKSHLVSENGLVEVFFHKKSQPNPNWLNPKITTTWVWGDYNYNPPFHTTGGSDRCGDHIYLNSITNNADFDNNNITYCCSGDSKNVGANAYQNQAKKGSEETGRVESGRESNQDFHSVNEEFNSWHDHVVEYHILPTSTKQKTIQDIKQYCGECGRRRRKNENFCPSCGCRC